MKTNSTTQDQINTAKETFQQLQTAWLQVTEALENLEEVNSQIGYDIGEVWTLKNSAKPLQEVNALCMEVRYLVEEIQGLDQAVRVDELIDGLKPELAD